AVEAGEERFARDDGFDLPAFWAERAEQFARSILRAQVVVRLSARGVRGLPHAVDALSAREALAGAEAPDADG
ncbi:transcriptional regulator, partial [Streptomyces sp. 4F]